MAQPHPADAGLVADARGGDKAAFAALVERHYPRLLAVCARATGDAHLAGDAAQQAVIGALLGLRGLRRPDRFGAWLVGVGLNVSRSLVRERSRQPCSLEAALGGCLVTEPAAAEPGPADLVEALDVADRVRDAIATLPPGQRAAVTLFYLSGLTHAEVAEHLGTGVGGVKTRLHKARTALRQQLTGLREEQPSMPEDTATSVPMVISDVRRREEADSTPYLHVVLLEEVGGDRRLPIWVGPAEATALALRLEGVELPRPGSYRFTADLLAAAGAQVRKVRITALTDKVFYAQALLEAGPPVDARPSDALNLALVTGAPIHVEREVLDAAQGQQAERRLAEALDSGDDARVLAEETRTRLREQREALRECERTS